MRWNTLIMIVVLAALAFGGTFTCKGHHESSTVPAPMMR
jgi:hypothetical protein